MITVLDAGARQGFTGFDHLIDSSRMREIVGKEFRSVPAALNAAGRRCFIRAHGDQPQRKHWDVWVKVRMANGEVVTRV